VETSDGRSASFSPLSLRASATCTIGAEYADRRIKWLRNEDIDTVFTARGILASLLQAAAAESIHALASVCCVASCRLLLRFMKRSLALLERSYSVSSDNCVSGQEKRLTFSRNLGKGTSVASRSSLHTMFAPRWPPAAVDADRRASKLIKRSEWDSRVRKLTTC